MIGNYEHQIRQGINRGFYIQESGCNGSNYYRFYVVVAEAFILSPDVAQASMIADRFDKYTVEKPCEWASHYIDLIHSNVFDMLNSYAEKSSQAVGLIQYGLMHDSCRR